MTSMTAAVADNVREATEAGLDTDLATPTGHRLPDRRSLRSGIHDVAALALIGAAQLAWVASLGYGLYRLA